MRLALRSARVRVYAYVVLCFAISSSAVVFVQASRKSTHDGCAQDCGHPAAWSILCRTKKAFSIGTLLQRLHPEVQRVLRRAISEDAFVRRCGGGHEGDREESQEDSKKERHEHVASTKQACVSSGVARNDSGLRSKECGARRICCRWHLFADPRAGCTLQGLRST